MWTSSTPPRGRFADHDTLIRAGGIAAARLAPALRALREGGARAAMTPRRWGRGPMAVFLPAGPAEGAALLRIYNMAHALRRLGWRTAVLPWRLSLPARHRCLAAAAPEVVVMQGARHGLNRPALYSGYRLVYDMDDADFHLPHLAVPVAEAMQEVDAVIAGSRYIAEWSRDRGARAAHVVWTGTPVPTRPRPDHHARPFVVAWAQTRPARHAGEAALVRRAIRGLAARHPGITLRLYDRRAGDDPAFAASFAAPGLTVEWREACAYDDYLASFDDVALGLAPLCPDTPFSRGKSFGKVLAYLGAGVPVLGSDAGEHGEFFTASTGVITRDPDRWASAGAVLLGAPHIRQDMADRAFDAFRARLSLEAAAARTSRVLGDLVAAPREGAVSGGPAAA